MSDFKDDDSLAFPILKSTRTKAIQVFSAAVTLLFEAQNTTAEELSADSLEDVEVCVACLRGVQSQNVLARYALVVLPELLGR